MKRHAGMRGMRNAEPVAMETLSSYLHGALPRPPRSFDYSTRIEEFPVALNDDLENSPVAAVIHLLQLMYAEIGEQYIYPGDDAVRIVSESFISDKGIPGREILNFWMQHGLFGTRITGYVPVNIFNRKEMASAISAFGGLYLGAAMPENAEEQFEDGEPWDLTYEPLDGLPSWGHCFVATGCNRFGIDIVTWGEPESMTWEWWETYGMEAWAVIPQEFVEVNYGPIWSLDMLKLLRDLNNL